MPALLVKSTQIIAPLERFLGPDLKVVRASSLFHSASIESGSYEIEGIDSLRPEQEGFLYSEQGVENRPDLFLLYVLPTTDIAVSLRICMIRFLPDFFKQYPADILLSLPLQQDGDGREHLFPVCSISTGLLGQMHNPGVSPPFMAALRRHEVALQLLRRALECIRMPFTVCQVPACRFLAMESEREKIQEAVEILRKHIDQPLTIPELARKVAMNECYLKKGFKSMTGKTIHEYYQQLRLEKAKELLGQEGRTVTEVAHLLGFSSISHFSTAFKRAIGMRPCELLG